MKWTIGDVTVTKIVELEVTGGSRFLLPQATREAILPIAWLRPHFADEDGRLRMSIHSFIVETPTRRIIVDTCLGNDKTEPADPALERSRWAVPGRPGGGRLSGANSIDTVLCTHLHVDHVGWNTRLVERQMGADISARPLPDGAAEYEHWSTLQDRARHGAYPGGLGDADLRGRPGDHGGDQRTDLRGDRSGADAGPHARPCQRDDPVARRTGTDHRRLHAPSLSDRPSRNGAHWPTSDPDRGTRRGGGCSSGWRERRCWSSARISPARRPGGWWSTATVPAGRVSRLKRAPAH